MQTYASIIRFYNHDIGYGKRWGSILRRIRHKLSPKDALDAKCKNEADVRESIQIPLKILIGVNTWSWKIHRWVALQFHENFWVSSPNPSNIKLCFYMQTLYTDRSSSFPFSKTWAGGQLEELQSKEKINLQSESLSCLWRTVGQIKIMFPL